MFTLHEEDVSDGPSSFDVGSSASEPFLGATGCCNSDVNKAVDEVSNVPTRRMLLMGGFLVQVLCSATNG